MGFGRLLIFKKNIFRQKDPTYYTHKDIEFVSIPDVHVYWYLQN